jgi:hypothetical protein
MKTASLALPLVLALAACHRPQAPAAEEPAGPAQAAAAPAPAPRYVGRWAASQDLCRTGAWDFAPRRLETAGEVACAFRQVVEVPGGYDIHALCTAEAPPKPYDLRLRFAQSARALLVEGGPFEDAGLVWCGAGDGPFGTKAGSDGR